MQENRFQLKLLLYKKMHCQWKLFEISVISVDRLWDKEGGLPKGGRENKICHPSGDVIDSF